MPEHNFKNKDGSFNMDVLKAWRDHLGGDHVLKQHDRYLIVETIQEIEYETTYWIKMIRQQFMPII